MSGTTQPAREPLASSAAWLALGTGFFAWGLLLNFTAGIGLADEAWFVRVGQRLLEGDALYRDVAYGATPLAAWVMWAASALFGLDVLVLKVLVALCFAVSSVTCVWCAERAGASRSTLLLLALSLAVFTPELLQALYSPLAQVFFLLTFALLASDTPLSAPRALAVGITVGLCFASKQNFALLALAAILASRFPRRLSVRELRSAALFCGAFTLTVTVVLSPIAWQHGTSEFLDYAFLSKGTYAELARIPYSHGLIELTDLIVTASAWSRLRTVAFEAQFILPLLVAISLTLRAIHDRRRHAATPSITLVAFVIAGFLGAWPRFDLVHLSYSLPWLFLGLIRAFSGLFPPVLLKAIRTTALLALALLAGDQLIRSAQRLTAAEYGFSHLPHLRGALVEWQLEENILNNGERIASAARGHTMFLLSSTAGLYHLTTGIRNHTPYDYPFATDFGRGGEARVREALIENRLQYVCLEPQIDSSLAPPLLLEYVQQRMVRGPDLGACTLYRGAAVAEWQSGKVE